MRTTSSVPRWIRLAEPALRALTAPLGITTVTVDPRFSAPAPEDGDAPGEGVPVAVRGVHRVIGLVHGAEHATSLR
ncbi:hypothetical protein ACWGKQ_14605 [Streptomyces sp. NPDC054770]